MNPKIGLCHNRYCGYRIELVPHMFFLSRFTVKYTIYTRPKNNEFYYFKFEILVEWQYMGNVFFFSSKLK